MPLKSLEHLAATVPYETLPPNWNTFDLERFSPGKRLWEYQQKSLKLALSVLFKFYDEFDNYIPGQDAPVHLELRELREYPEAKFEAPGGLLGRDSTLRVYFYRSDNLSDEHKDRIVDFRNYDNNGRWYSWMPKAA